MLTICLILVSIGLITNLAVYGVSIYAVIKEKQRISNSWSEYFDQTAADEPSNFAKTVSQIADMAAERTRISLMAADRGQQGAAVRDATRGLEQVAIENNPGLAVAQLMPKALKKNKLAEVGLGYLIQNIMSKQGQGAVPGLGNNGSGIHGHQPKFDL